MVVCCFLTPPVCFEICGISSTLLFGCWDFVGAAMAGKAPDFFSSVLAKLFCLPLLLLHLLAHANLSPLTLLGPLFNDGGLCDGGGGRRDFSFSELKTMV